MTRRVRLASDGGPIRVDAPAGRRLRAGERPERISATWPAIEDAPGARGHRAVTFAVDAPAGHEAMVHLNGITDAHRGDIRPALMEPVGGGVHTLTYLLPDDLCASYRFATAPRLARDAGATREGWLRIHTLGRPDPRGTETLPNPLGTSSSVLRMPGAPVHPGWAAVPADPPPITTVSLPDAPLTIIHGDGSAVLLLFDGEWWEQLGIAAALTRRGGAVPHVVLIPSGSMERRSALLPHPDRLLPHLVDDVVPAVGAVLGGWDADRTIVAGQSYGGLAAAMTVCLRPDVAGTAIAQSGSFHVRAGEEPRPPDGRHGDLVAALAGHRVSGRFLVQAGTEEQGMIDGARAFADAASAAGGRVTTRWYTGGHDYAWWRTGLFDALDALGAPSGSTDTTL